MVTLAAYTTTYSISSVKSATGIDECEHLCFETYTFWLSHEFYQFLYFKILDSAFNYCGIYIDKYTCI